MISRRGLLKLLGTGFLALSATAAYPFVEVFGRPIIRQYAFSPRGWTPGLKLRAAVLADIHACEPWMTISRIDSICRQTMDLEPDAGISTHVNDAVRLEKDGHGFWLAGLGDQLALLPGKSYGRKRMQGIDDLDATLAKITDDAPVIMMAHEPDIFPSMSPRVSLTLSGHTHGGQINFFGWRPFPASRGSAVYPAGYFNDDGRELIVSRGLGCSVLPLRIGSYPEILLLDLG